MAANEVAKKSMTRTQGKVGPKCHRAFGSGGHQLSTEQEGARECKRALKSRDDCLRKSMLVTVLRGQA